ncbi:Gaa1-like protein [Pholiota conissans]|uniref:Gaa1-like protein n=1 Tax=Pholiota conissans TaxID=109636 RepID=A0A9P5YWA0_9AGAR|nr:Gaa1-like protein [Pholiota conissans]
MVQRLPFIKVSLLLIGYLWMLAIPAPYLGRNVYIDENALQPGQVNTDWNWDDVHVADLYLVELEKLRDGNYTNVQRAQWLSEEFSKLGITSSTQHYSFNTSRAKVVGTNAYAVLASPRHSGTEAIVISASWISRIGEIDGTINIRGVATVLALANFLKRYSYWGKDIVFVISDGYLDGMQAWLFAYHDVSQCGLHAEPLQHTSGVIWSALNIDYPGHSFSHLGIFSEGLNGRLPNQDLINSVSHIAQATAGVPVVLYDHIDHRQDASVDKAPSWLPRALYNIPEIKTYLYQGRNVMQHLASQFNGRGDGVHGLFHQFRIDAITIFAVPAIGPHGFYAIGRIVESSLRTVNNLLERLHASFFFYIMTSPQRFLKIGLYLPSAILISVAIMFHGLGKWADAAWIKHNLVIEDDKTSLSFKGWTRRRRPMIPALSIMIATHCLGFVLFKVISSSTFAKNFEILSPLVFLVFSSIPLIVTILPEAPNNEASLSTVLKALNLCFASTVISIVTLLNFSLAASLSVYLGFPLIISSSSSKLLRFAKYAAYCFFGLGWLLVGHNQTLEAVWNWEVLSVWFAPFICIVVVPLVLQAGLVCIIST